MTHPKRGEATVTTTQLAAMREIERSISGRLIFGSGFGRYRVALRPLAIRLLVGYSVLSDGQEEFSLTPAGRAILNRAEADRGE